MFTYQSAISGSRAGGGGRGRDKIIDLLDLKYIKSNDDFKKKIGRRGIHWIREWGFEYCAWGGRAVLSRGARGGEGLINFDFS